MSLLEKYAEGIKESTSVVETLNIKVKRVIPFKDVRKLRVDTDKGTFFVWKDTIRGIADVMSLPHSFEAELTLTQKGEYVNVTELKPNLESLGKYNFVATNKLAVAL